MAKAKVPSVVLEGTDLVIRIPLDAKGVASGSGKSVVLGSSRGNRPIEDLLGDGAEVPDVAKQLKVGFNVYRPK